MCNYISNEWNLLTLPKLCDVEKWNFCKAMAIAIEGLTLNLYVLVISQYKYDILVITPVRGEAEDEC